MTKQEHLITFLNCRNPTTEDLLTELYNITPDSSERYKESRRINLGKLLQRARQNHNILYCKKSKTYKLRR